MPNAITGTGGNINYLGDEKKSSESTLDKDSFLKLLVAQMTHQDPTNPTNPMNYCRQ